MINHLETNNKPGLLFFADFQRAFDSLNHKCILDSLKSFNFGPTLIRWIEIFYNKISSTIINNGFMSEDFLIEKGVRQGCPLSSFLFILCLQILTNYITLNKNIGGIKVDNEEIKQTLFADDATFFNDGKQKSFEELINTLHKYSKCSGLNLNTNKSIVLRVGALKSSKLKYCTDHKFTWTSENATALGITFYTQIRDTVNKNVEKKINEFQMTLKQWLHRKLTLMGKITVVKTFALPKLIYPLTVLSNPNIKLIEDIQKDIFKFIWNGKPDKIKRCILYQQYEFGGLKLTDLKSFIQVIKANWIKRYLDEQNNGQWKVFIKNKLDKYGNKLIFDCEIDEKFIKKVSNGDTFLNNILSSWQRVQNQYNKENIHIAKTIIWNNKNITQNDKTFFYKTWYQKGIMHLEHLVDYRTQTFYDFETFSNIYDINKNEYLKYYQIIKSISPEIKNKLIKTGITLTQSAHLSTKILNTKNTNHLLNNLLRENTVKPTSEEKWENIFQDYNLSSEWQSLYRSIYTTTIDTVLRNFQYKLIMRILPTNTLLFKYKYVNSNLCDFCNCHDETIEHIFWECHVSQSLWSNLNNFIQENSINGIIRKKEALLGHVNNNNININLLNTLILMMKYFIYTMKLNKSIPTFPVYLRYLKRRVYIEKLIAYNQDKVNTHNKKYEQLNQIIEI